VCQTTSKPLRALGIGPGDWLIIPPEALAVTLRQGVHPEIEGQDLSLLEITDALSTLAITGRGAEAVLSTDCGLDWSPDRFPVGQCARTRFANVPVIVEKVDDLPRFELTVGSSYLAYLTAWLADAVSLYCTSDCE
jgi:heterotetrameric sarcosine oxidase gamma subunit